jgi:hypothetical protein
MANKNFGFLIEVFEEYEYSLAPPYDSDKETAYSKLGNFFAIDENKENVEARLRKFLPDSKKYRIDVRQAEQEIEGIYKLGIIRHIP